MNKNVSQSIKIIFFIVNNNYNIETKKHQMISNTSTDKLNKQLNSNETS